MPLSTGAFVQTDRVAGMVTGITASRATRVVAICMSNWPVLFPL